MTDEKRSDHAPNDSRCICPPRAGGHLAACPCFVAEAQAHAAVRLARIDGPPIKPIAAVTASGREERDPVYGASGEVACGHHVTCKECFEDWYALEVERDALRAALARSVEIAKRDFQAREDDEDGPPTMCSICAMGLDEHGEDCLVGIAIAALATEAT